MGGPYLPVAPRTWARHGSKIAGWLASVSARLHNRGPLF